MFLADGTTTLNITAEPSAPPQTTVDEEMIEKIKVAMSDRYVPENKGMNTDLGGRTLAENIPRLEVENMKTHVFI